MWLTFGNGHMYITVGHKLVLGKYHEQLFIWYYQIKHKTNNENKDKFSKIVDAAAVH